MASTRFAALGDSWARVRVQYVFSTTLARYVKWCNDDDTDDVLDLHAPLRVLNWLKACLVERDGRAVADALAAHALDVCSLLRVAIFAHKLLPSVARACSLSSAAASAFVAPTCFARMLRCVACHVTTLKPSQTRISILWHGLRLVALQLPQRGSIVVRLPDELKTNAAVLTMAALAASSEFDEQQLAALWTDAADVWVHRSTRAAVDVLRQQWLAFLDCLSLPLMRTSALLFRTWCMLVMKLGRCIPELSAAAVPLRAALELWHTCHAKHEQMGAHHILGLAVWLVRVERPRFAAMLAPVDAPLFLALAAAMRTGAFAPDVAHIVYTWLANRAPRLKPDVAPEPALSATAAAAARQLRVQLQLYLVAGGVRQERTLQRCQDAVRVLSALTPPDASGGAAAVPDMLRCMLCCVAPVNCVFLPCGHLAACLTCAARLLGAVMRCPVCRGESEAKPVFPLDAFTAALRAAPRTPRDAAWPICAYEPWDVGVLYDAPTLRSTRRSVLPLVPLLVTRLCAADLAALANTCVALQRAVRAAWVLSAPPAVVTALRARDSHGCRPWLMLVLNQPRVAPAAHLAPLQPGDVPSCWWAVLELPDRQRALVQCTNGVVTACLSVRRWGAKTCAELRLNDAVMLTADALRVTTPTASLRVVEAFACLRPRKHTVTTASASASTPTPARPRTLFKRHAKIAGGVTT